MASQRLCKDCKHFVNKSISGLSFGKCRLTKTHPFRINPVDGQRVDEYASVERESYGECGPDGKLYEFELDRVARFRNAWQVPATDSFKYAAVVVACIYISVYMVQRILS